MLKSPLANFDGMEANARDVLLTMLNRKAFVASALRVALFARAIARVRWRHESCCVFPRHLPGYTINSRNLFFSRHSFRAVHATTNQTSTSKSWDLQPLAWVLPVQAGKLQTAEVIKWKSVGALRIEW